MKSRWVPDPLDGVLLIALVAVVLSVTYAYVSTERFFYYWDFAVHQDLAWTTAAAFRESWGAGWREVRRSLAEDYNALFAVPLAPLLGRLWDSRLAYEGSLALVYLCPFVLSIGALATRVISGPARTVFWTAAWLTLFVPMAWVPTLRGYPDAGAATLVVVASCVYLREDDHRSIRDAAVIGVLLTLSVLFRRHFLYAALAFVVSAIVYELARAVSRHRHDRRELRTACAALGARIVVGALAATVLMAALGRGFVERLRSYDFASLYRGYEEPALVVLGWYARVYGAAVLALAALGVIAGWRSRILHRSRMAFLALFGALSLLQWLLAVRQLGEQYTLHFTPVIVLGLAALLWTIWSIEAPLRRAVARTAFTVVLVANVLFGLSTVAVGSSVRRAFGGAWVPLVRWDYETLAELVEYLRKTTNPEEGLYVVASSHAINPDILRHAEWTLHGRRDVCLDLLSVPAIDSRDEYPLGALLEAQHVILVRPLQTHLRPEEQRVLGVVYDLFTKDEEIARDFTERPDRFALHGGAAISVYSRRRPTDLPTALRTLAVIEQQVPTRPGQLPDWTVVSRRYRAWVTRNRDSSTKWVAHPSPRGQTPSTVLAWLGPKTEQAEILGTVTFVDQRCLGATLAFATADAGGMLTPLATIQRRPGEDGRFRLPLAAGAGRLVISLLDYAEGASIDYCLLTVDPLVLRPAPH
jgi:hypothetical protein